MSAADLLFYTRDDEKKGQLLDVPIKDGNIVTINLVDELADDPSELTGFLLLENSARKHWLAIASAYCANHKLTEAKQVVDEAAQQPAFSDDDRAAIDIYRGWLELKFAEHAVGKARFDHYNEAQAVFDHLPREVQAKAPATLLQAQIYLGRDRLDDARPLYDQVLKRDPSNCIALMGKAHIAMAKQNYQIALKLLQQVLMIKPTMRPDPRVAIGVCFWLLNDHKMAVKLWERLVKLYPDDSHRARVLLELSKLNDTFTKLVTDEDFIKNYTESITNFGELQTANDYVPALVLALYFFLKRDFDTVRNVVLQIGEKIIGEPLGDSDSARFRAAKTSKFELVVLSQCALWLARCEFAEGNFTLAQKHFGELIKLNDNLQAKLGLGLAQLNRGLVEDAIMTYELILKTNSKCLEVVYLLGVLYSQLKSKRKHELAVQLLERYVRLASSADFKEPVMVNAFLVLAQLYESKDIGQLLKYLQRAIETQAKIERDVPVEVYNNIGVYHFLRKNFDEATKVFALALDKTTGPFTSEDGDVLADLPGDLEVTIKFNRARSLEVSDQAAAIEVYKQLEQECSHYVSSKLRLLFLDCIATHSKSYAEIKTELDELLAANALDLEIRSFYGWFAKNFGKKVGLKADADNAFHRDTLVTYESHDCYALISLANIYCIMARDAKSDDSKRRNYYLRAAELYIKVLSIDPKDVYAAQGLAITYIENKETSKGLDVLSKIRDSLNDITVYLNLGHALLEAKNFAKAIENYEVALGRFTDGKDTKILSFLGRAWYLRGQQEKHLPFLKRAKEYTEKALANVGELGLALIQFNLAFVDFQIAEFITKQPANQCDVEEIEQAMRDLEQAIEQLRQLAGQDDDHHVPYPKADLAARANLGLTALLPRLQTCLDETKLSIEAMTSRIEEAKRIREEEAARKRKEEEEQAALAKQKEEERARERAKELDQSHIWAEEFRAANVDVVPLDNDDDGDAADAKPEKQKKTKGTKRKANGGRRKKKVLSDDEESSAQDTDPEADEPESKKRKTLSNARVEDSDEDLGDIDNDLF